MSACVYEMDRLSATIALLEKAREWQKRDDRVTEN